MKKFLKTTLAGVALLGCATGLVGCGSNNDTTDASIAPEKAYETVYGAMGTNFSGIARGFGETTESTETKNKLTIDLNILNQSTDFSSNQTDETKMSFQAILQTCFGGNKNQLSFALGLKKDNEFDELINAYISDPEINPSKDLQEVKSETDFNNAVLVYKLKSGVITPTAINDFTKVSDTETYQEGTTYYAVTSAKLTAYLSSNLYKLASFELVSEKPTGWEDGAYVGYYYVVGDLEEGEDFRTKIKEFVNEDKPKWVANKYYKVSDNGSSLNEVPEMLYYGKTAITTDLVELMGSLSEYLPSTTLEEADPGVSEDPSSDDSQLSALMPIISSAINGEMEYEDFNTYVKLLTSNQVSISGRTENGNTVLSINYTSNYEGGAEAITIELIAYADGAFGISYHEVYSYSYEGAKRWESVTSISCKMTLTSDFDNTLVPDLSSDKKYTEVSLEDIIAGLIGGGSGEESPEYGDVDITE